MNRFLHETNAIREELIRARRRLHRFAECGFDLSKTTDFVKETLLSMGYEPASCGKSGVTASLPADNSTAPTILLRADMDALPMHEETRLSFRAENGCMHACGHDMHAAMLLGAAALLKKREGKLPFSVRFAFQGAEEILSGAADMVAHGVLDGVTAAVMLHAIPARPYPTGTVLLPPEGVGAPAAVFFSVKVKGESAHAGKKNEGCDALRAALGLYEALCEEEKRIGGDLSLAIGTLHAGDAPNVVAGHARMTGTFRSKSPDEMHAFHRALKRVLSATPDGITANAEMGGGCPPLFNHPTAREAVRSALEKEGVPFVVPTATDGAAAEDFAVIAERVPSVARAIAAGQAGHGYDRPLHHPSVLFDEDALPHGAAIYTISALALGEAFSLQTFTKMPIV